MLDCKRWEEVRFVATSLCSSVKDGKKYDLLPPVCAQRWEELRFVATSLRCSIVKDVKKYGLLPPVCSIVEDGKKHDLLPPVLCSIVKDGKKDDLLPPVCARLSKMGRSTICCHEFALDCQRWEKVRFIHNSFAVLDGQRWEKVRFVATSLRCSVVKDGKKYVLLPPVCGARLSKMGRSSICCHQFVLECQ